MGYKSRSNYKGVCVRQCANRDKDCNKCVRYSYYKLQETSKEGIKIKYLYRDKMTPFDVYSITIPKHKILEWAKAPGIKVKFNVAISHSIHFLSMPLAL